MLRSRPILFMPDRVMRGVLDFAACAVRSTPDRDAALAHYRKLAPTYDAMCTRIAAVRACATSLLAARPGETVVDVACGTGAMLPGLAAQVGNRGRVIGIEQCAEMIGLARARFAGGKSPANVRLLALPAEEARLGHGIDAYVFSYAQDVLQSSRALANLFAAANPGARVVVAGMRLLPWWYAAPINLWCCWRARRYLTTLRGLRRPWTNLNAFVPNFRIVQHFHGGTSYVGVGVVGGHSSSRGRDECLLPSGTRHRSRTRRPSKHAR